MEKKSEEVVRELGSSPDDCLYKVIRGFFLRVVDGPLVSVSPGDTVRLSYNTAGPLFIEGRILPLSLPEAGRYAAIKNFVHINERLWVLVEKGDMFKLSLDEALPLLREFKIRLIDEEKGGKKNEAKS